MGKHFGNCSKLEGVLKFQQMGVVIKNGCWVLFLFAGFCRGGSEAVERVGATAGGVGMSGMAGE